MRTSSVLLIHPPGWDVCVSGPYSAGPYIQGWLRAAGYGCRWVDLNLLMTNHFSPRMSAGEVDAADHAGADARDALYFGRQDPLDQIARPFGGSWTLRESFQPSGLEVASSASLRALLDTPAPYDHWVETALAKLLSEETPTFVGLTVTIPQQLFGAFRVARAIRALEPSIPIVLGGNIPTRLADEMSHAWVFDFVDILATYQGEHTLAALLSAGVDRQQWSRVPNILYREDGHIRSSGRKLLEPAQFRQPDYDGVRFDEYWGHAYATIMASRGCYYGKCPFCAIPYTWGESGFRGHDDPALVADTMARTADRHGVTRFKFVEESLHAKVVDRLSGRLLEMGLNTTWEGYVRLDRPWFDPRFLDRAARAGLRKVYVGLEQVGGGSRSVLGKHDRPDALQFLETLKDVGILAHVFVLVGHPGTGLREATETIEFALKHRRLIDTLEVNGFRYEKHTNISGVQREPDPHGDWALDDPYSSRLEPTFSPRAVDLLESEFLGKCSSKVPHWTHPIHHMASPWNIPRRTRRRRVVAA